MVTTRHTAGMTTPPWPPPQPSDLTTLDLAIAALQEKAVGAHRAFVAADGALRAALRRREELVGQLTQVPPVGTAPGSPAAAPVDPVAAASAATAPATASAASPGPADPATAWAGGRPPALPVSPRVGETSTRTVQNVLFVLGGLLLGLAAIVFTAVAWATFGVQGRAEALGAVTLLALGLPVVALARRLRATAETFAAVALLLVGLDGYAAWYVDL